MGNQQGPIAQGTLLNIMTAWMGREVKGVRVWLSPFTVHLKHLNTKKKKY